MAVAPKMPRSAFAGQGDPRRRPVIEWEDTGLILSARPHGESAAIVNVFTPSRGRHAGIVLGGAGRRMEPVLQSGAQVALTWRARIEDHLGTFTVEPLHSRSGLLGDPLGLAALSAICALLGFALPERQTFGTLYAVTQSLLGAIGRNDDWPARYALWEAALLDETGFGLDLGACAVTGATAGLAFVSPRTGRAVTRAAAGVWADRLLPLPSLLLRGDRAEGDGDDSGGGVVGGRVTGASGIGGASGADILDALAITGHFLDRSLAAALGDRPLPPARDRFVARLRRRYAAAGGALTGHTGRPTR